MAKLAVAISKNPVLEWLWKHGWEEPVGPLGPIADPSPQPWRLVDPQPEPWREAVVQLVEAVQAKDLVSKLKDGALRKATEQRAEAAISMVLDDWCGTPPRKHPWPWPGPPPWTWAIASELNAIASSLQAGSLRDGLLDAAAQTLQKASGQGAG